MSKEHTPQKEVSPLTDAQVYTPMQPEAWRVREVFIYIALFFLCMIPLILGFGVFYTQIRSYFPLIGAPIEQILVYLAMLAPLYYIVSKKRGTDHEVRIPLRWPGYKLGVLFPVFALLTLYVLLSALVAIAGGELLGVTGTKVSIAAMPQDPLSTVLLVLAAGILAPVVEEILFRGALLPALLQRYTPWIAISISALLFAFAHTNQLGAAIILFCVGIFAGTLAWRADSVIPAIIFHMLNNTVALLFDYFGGGLM